MSTTTSNLKLLKPELTDSADITAYNENWDKIDQEFGNKVSKNGDTIKGNLKIEGAVSVERSDSNRQARTVVHNNAEKEVDFQNYGDDNNYISLRVGTETKGVGDALKVTQMNGGSFSSYTLLHTGNKEKIFTSGTEDLVSGSSSLGTGQLYFVYE
jgi:hypothetical protein